MTTTRKHQVEGHCGPATSTLTYVIADASTQRTAIVVNGGDHGPKPGRRSKRGAGALVGRASCAGLSVQWPVESHTHQGP